MLVIGSAAIVWAISRVDIDNTSSFGYSADHFEVDSGDCETGCTYWAGIYGYMYGGYGDFDSGTGSGYYGWEAYWYTDENELDGGEYAKCGVLVDYEENRTRQAKLISGCGFSSTRNKMGTGSTWEASSGVLPQVVSRNLRSGFKSTTISAQLSTNSGSSAEPI